MTFEPYTLSRICSITGGQLQSSREDDPVIREFLIDSRRLVDPAGCLFIALVTQRNDGHRYIEELYGKGVRNFLIQDTGYRMPDAGYPMPDAAFILVRDTLVALQELAAYHRGLFTGPVVGITGSNGKTIVKEWLFQLMSPDKRIIRSPRSFNSQIGVPLSVLKTDDTHDFAIFEAGISQPGEMEHLGRIIRPTIGLITKVLGTQLPGPGTIYMSQSLKFRAPVRIGETVTATVEVTTLHPEKRRATLRTVCTVRGEPVLEGEAYVSVPSRLQAAKVAE